MSKILITAKISPDLDGVACAYAYAKLLNFVDKKNEYIAGFYGEPLIEAKYLFERFNIIDGFVYNPEMEFAKFILVDASELKGMPEVIRANDVIEAIDHRSVHHASEIFPKAKIQIEEVGAAATLIFEKYQELKLPLDEKSVYLLLGAIYSNTLNFQSDITNQRDRDAVQSLERSGVFIPENLISQMFEYKSEFINNNLEQSIIGDFKAFDNGVGIAQLEGFNLNQVVERQIKKIKEILKNLKEKHNLKFIFLTAADLKNNYNNFVAIDKETKLLLTGSLGLSFDDRGIAKNNKLILRKQIMPLLIPLI